MSVARAKQRRTWVYLFSATGSVLLLAIAAFAAVSLIAVRRTAYRQSEDNLKQFSYAVTRMLDTESDLLEPSELQRFCENLGSDREFRVTFILADGSVLADSGANPATLENHALRPEVTSALNGKEKAVVRYSESLKKKMVYYAVPYHGNVLRLAVSVGYIDTAARQIALILMASAFTILVVALGVSILASRSIIVPLQRLEDAAHRFAGGVLDIKLDSRDFPREFGELASTLSLMAARLDEKIGALDAQNQETSAILAGMNDALIVLDGEKRVVRINRAASELFALDAEGCRGLPLIQAVRNTEIVDFAARADARESELTIELRTGQTEASRFLLVKSGDSGTNGGKILVFSDITRLKRLERIRKDFVANVSHELKTPITSIQGFIETLKEGAIDEPVAARRFLDIMDQQTSRLGAIIDDLLSISRLEQNEQAAIPREECNIAEIFESVQGLCAEDARKKKTSLEFSVAEDISCSLNPGLFEQAITNLVLNAIKYSPQGTRVSVVARMEKDGVGTGQNLVCEVSDNGIGIPEKHRERIFERFYRIDKGRSREQGGTGLGLSIVRHIALAHGGTVSVDSAEGEGSTFRIVIPTRVNSPAR